MKQLGLQPECDGGISNGQTGFIFGEPGGLSEITRNEIEINQQKNEMLADDDTMPLEWEQSNGRSADRPV